MGPGRVEVVTLFWVIESFWNFAIGCTVRDDAYVRGTHTYTNRSAQLEANHRENFFF